MAGVLFIIIDGLFAMELHIIERERLEEILRFIGEGVIYQEADGKIRFFNQTAQRIFGISEDQALGRTYLEPDWYLTHEDGSLCPGPEHPSMVTLRTGEALSDQIRGISRPGQATIWLSINTIPIFGTDQESPEAVVISFSDITERKQTEEALEKQERYLDTILQTNADGFWMVDRQGKLTQVNKAYCAMTGYTREELLGRSIGDSDANESPEDTRDRIQRIMANGSDLFETLHRRKDGSIFPIEVSVTYLDEDGGQFVCFGRDQSERKQNEESITLLGSMLDDAPISITIHDTTGRFLYANQKTLAMHGYSDLDELLKINLHDLDLPESEALIAERFRKIDQDGEATFEVAHYRKDGSTFPLEVTAKKILWQGQPALLSMATDITERKRNEEALQSENLRRRLLMDASRDGIAIFNQEHRVVEANQRFCEMLGYSQEEVLRLYTWDFEANVSEEQIRADFADVSKTNKTFETKHRRKDGSIYDVEVSASGALVQGEPLVVTISRDITDRKRAEEEQRLHSLVLEQIHDVVTLTDMEGHISYVNDACCQLLGRTKEELLGRHIATLGEDPAEGATQDEIIQQTLTKGYWRGQVVNLDAKGDRIILDCRTQIVTNAQGQPIALCGISTDITERRQAEEELRKQRQRLAGIIEGANVGTWEWNVQTGEAVFNQRWAEIIGYTLEELTPISIDTWKQYAHPDDFEASKKQLERHFGGELGYYDCECRMRHKDGHWVWVLDRGKVISRTDDGEPLWMFGTHIDITDLKNAEKEQARLQVQLAQAQKMDALGTLSSGIAHDFNNILAAILGYSELALDELPEDNPSVRQDLSEITKAAMKAKKLVRQILTFSRVAEGQRRPLSVGRVAQEARAILERTLPKMIDLELGIQEGLWPVTADPQQMEQVFINLAANAADAIEGSGTVTISARNMEPGADSCRYCGEELAGPQVLITVEDDGEGMGPEVQSKLFEPFFTTKGVGKGTGLGLSTVYGIVTGHGGHICCQSKVGEGSTFFIYLPASLQGDPSSEAKEMDSPEDFSGSGKILVVDDEPVVRDIAYKMLTRNGYEVLQAASGEEALTVYQERAQEIDLILLDLGMPGMGGKACLKELRQVDPDARVLIASGYIQYELTDELESLGAMGMVSKPYRKADILKAVKEALGSYLLLG